jgi:beta-lactamase superfamily II metal-dependent hydrolase
MSFSRRKRSAFIICLTALLSIALFFILYDPAQPASSPASVPLTVTVIDAGQGDSILVTFGAETMLIDAAEKYESDDVLGALEKQGVDDIDILIASHPHDDHIGGLESVIEKYDIGKLYMADTPCETKTYGRLMEAVSDKDIPVLEAYAGVTFTLGQASCTIVSPDREDDFDANNESVGELVEEQQTFEAEVVSGVENAPPADEAEVTTHGEHPGEDDIPPEKL